MVNLRKIGAVATGALFVGATIGMASAVTVPDAFQNSLLADNGVAKAQLVVGANAPGKIEDKASAEIIQSAVASELAESGAGGQIEVKYGIQDLDDVSGDETWEDHKGVSLDGTGNVSNKNQTLDLGGYEDVPGGKDWAYISGEGLKFDANSDGDLSDSGDYTLYDGIWIIKGDDGTIRFGYDISNNPEEGYEDLNTSAFNEGEVVNLKGSTYAATDTGDLDNGEVELGPAITKKVVGGTDPKGDQAVIISENYKVYYKDINQTGGILYFYEGNGLLDTYTVPATVNNSVKLNDKVAVGSFEDKYHIYLVKYNSSASTPYVSMSFVDKDQTLSIKDEDEGIMGYDLAWVSNEKWDGKIILLSSVVRLVEDDTIDLEGTYYQLKFTDEGGLDIKREKTETKTSDSKWKSGKYDDFLRGSSGTDIWISSTGGQIEVKYGIQDLDDVSGDETWKDHKGVSLDGTGNVSNKNQTLDLGGYEDVPGGKDWAYISGEGLKFDANSDGDLSDSGDYTLYDGIWIIKGDDGTIRFGYDVSINTEEGFDDANTSAFNEGEVVNLKGSTYAATDTGDLDNGEVELGPAITKKVVGGTTPEGDQAVIISENYKVYFKTSNNAGGLLYFYEGNGLLDTYTVPATVNNSVKLNDKVAVGSFEDKYHIYLVKYNGTAATPYVSMSFVDKDQTFPIKDEDEGIMGYDLAWVSNEKWDGKIVLLSSVVRLVEDDTIDLEGTYYQLKFTDEGGLDIKREKTETKSSDSKWKAGKYDDFLQGSSGTDVWISVTGGDTVTPDVEIVDDADADTDGNNLFLIGGPVANTLTADLVTQEKSTVEWETSDGDIEVIADAFATGKTAVIVAGKDRMKTEAAAQALADAL